LVTNQIEVHPFLDQDKILAACRQHGLAVTAYCPIARGKVPGNEVLERIGKALARAPRRCRCAGSSSRASCRSRAPDKPDHMTANLAVLDFTLTDAEMAEIGKLKKPDGRVVNPSHAPKWD